jgi:two-component system, chemotaxis family, sensor kinase CheA
MLKLAGITDTAHHIEEILMQLRSGSLAYTAALGQLLHRGVDALADLIDVLADSADAKSLPGADADLCAALAHAAKPSGDAVAPPDAASDAPTAVAAALPESVSAPTPTPQAAQASATAAAEPTLKAAETVRIRLDKLDELVKLMGEVVSSHAALRQRLSDAQVMARTHAQGPLGATLHDYALALSDDVLAQEALMVELHDTTLRMRMLPLAIVFEPASRLVREMARSVGKEVQCQVSGSEYELDRQMIDKLADPIIHLIRNSLDHGLETPDKRLAAGKPAQGQLRISARADSGWMVIEVSDDGAGIAVAQVRDKAVKKGLVSAEKASALSEQEVIDFIFMPGFSTASIITDLSGRGVGMDVVKRCVLDDLRGVISVETRQGVGTTFALRLPLSLAVMRVLLIEVGGVPYAFTAQYVAELVRCQASALLTVGDRPVTILRNEFVPVVALGSVLHGPGGGAGAPALASPGGDSLLLLVLQVRGEKLAIVVDALVDERDMVIKPLPPHLRAQALVSGMVTTGKNELVNVLHAPALLDAARQARAQLVQAAAGGLGRTRRMRVLVVDDSLNTREIERDVLEASGFEVTLAEDGADGLRKAQAELFDAVMTDVEMPHMDGFTLTARLRQEENYRERPIIIVTSLAKEEDKRRGIQAGADAYIVKGDFDRSNLVDTLRSLLA